MLMVVLGALGLRQVMRLSLGWVLDQDLVALLDPVLVLDVQPEYYLDPCNVYFAHEAGTDVDQALKVRFEGCRDLGVTVKEEAV